MDLPTFTRRVSTLRLILNGLTIGLVLIGFGSSHWVFIVLPIAFLLSSILLGRVMANEGSRAWLARQFSVSLDPVPQERDADV